MKICITSKGPDLSSPSDPRFGRALYFIIIETETGEYEFIDNKAVSASGGAGVQAAKTVADKEPEILLTGNLGPNAFETLKAAGIDTITGISGTVENVIEKFKAGEYQKTDNATVSSHHGMK